ncbi:MAG: Smr/MutS family protein [Chlorobi bacterium]|nr:Smr/MutS family protein [Chlorobiota bacterium]
MQGKVVSVSKNKVVFQDEDGFEHHCRPDELVPAALPPQILMEMGKAVHKESPDSFQRKYSNSTPKIPIIDLHFEKITGKHTPEPGQHALEIQMDYLRKFLKKAKKARWRQFTVIHGKGSGILRKAAIREVRKAGYDIQDLRFDEQGGGGFRAYRKR